MACVEPFYPKPGRGRRPVPLDTMLRTYVLQHLFNYSDPAMEEALYEAPLYCRFVGIDLVVDTIPDVITLRKFSHLLERQHLSELFFDDVNGELERRGLVLRQGTNVDVSLIATPISKKSKPCKRDDEMSLIGNSGKEPSHGCRFFFFRPPD